MPQDSRRNCYQEVSKHPRLFDTLAYEKKLLINENGLRSDLRPPGDPRPVYIKTGIVTRSRGSSYIEVGSTKVICACYGPKQLQNKETSLNKGILVCEFRFASFSTVQHKTDQISAQEMELAALVVDSLSPSVILESFPKAQVDIHITVLEDGGSALASSITAASVALADAGIEMYSLVIGSSLKFCDDVYFIDPTQEEELQTSEKGKSCGCVTLGFMPSIGQISMINHQGFLEHQLLAKSIVILEQVCKNIYPLAQKCLLTSIEQLSKDLAS